MSFDDYMREETSGAEDLQPARDQEVAMQEMQLAGLEDAEHAQVAAGVYDGDASTTDLGALTRKVFARLAATLPKARPALKNAAARRIALSAMARVQFPNKMVPMSKLAMAPGTDETFVYKSPDPAVYMGIIMTPAVIANFGCTQFQRDDACRGLPAPRHAHFERTINGGGRHVDFIRCQYTRQCLHPRPQHDCTAVTGTP